MPRIVIGGFPWEVPVFAGDTGEDDKGRVLILRIGRGDVVRVFLLWGSIIIRIETTQKGTTRKVILDLDWRKYDELSNLQDIGRRKHNTFFNIFK